MDTDLFSSLEEKLTNIGTDRVYKRKIGKNIFWFSPLSFSDQEFVHARLEAEANPNSGDGVPDLNTVSETKLTALSRSIVGIDDSDLRSYRNGPKVFKIIGRDKKIQNVDLAAYLEYKIRDWGDTFVNIAFEIFADISESATKEFSEGVVFENAQDPRAELAELEVKVHQLRASLKLPVLVEKSGSKYASIDGEPDFDSFKNDEPEQKQHSEPEWKEEPEPIIPENLLIDPVKVNPTANHELNVDIDEMINSMKSGGEVQIKQAPKISPKVPSTAVSTPNEPLSLPSAENDDVIEKTSDIKSKVVSVDPVVHKQSINPRFKK